MLTKLLMNDPIKWYKHLPTVQQTLNFTFQRSIAMIIRLLTGVKIKQKDDLVVKDTLEKKVSIAFRAGS